MQTDMFTRGEVLPGWWDDLGLYDALTLDDPRLLITFIKNNLDEMRSASAPQKLLFLAIQIGDAIKCVDALINGLTPLTVDVNLPCFEHGGVGVGVYPIHIAAYNVVWMSEVSTIELLIHNGARTDIPVPEAPQSLQFRNCLPLEIVLHEYERVFQNRVLWQWKPRQSKYEFLEFLLPLCPPSQQSYLEPIAVLAGKTQRTDELFLKYAMQGKVVEFTTLLMVAYEKVKGIMDRVRQHLDSIEQPPTQRVLCMRQLVEVFEKAGDAISTYIKQDRYTVKDHHDSLIDVLCLIQEAGFIHVPWNNDVDLLNYLNLYNRHSPKGYVIRDLLDFGMAHYSQSGYRWEMSSKNPLLKEQYPQRCINDLQREIESLKDEKVNIIRQKQQPKLRIWMEDKFGKALDEDDKEGFLSVIDNNLDFFRLRQQQLLYAVCESGAIKCAEALINRETPLTVDLNLPCTDTGMYPLHCAALWSLPSMTELFLYRGARTDVWFTPWDHSYNYQQYELKRHGDMLPLHVALLGISHFPCMREWTSKHSIINLVTLLCLPRMQNPLETLGLLANTTNRMSEECIQFAIDGKFVELISLMLVADSDTRKSLLGKIRELDLSSCVLHHDHREKIQELAKIFEKHMGDCFELYLAADRSNVTKDQASKDVGFLFKGFNFEVSASDIDLSVYNWYQEEEHSYPLKAPFENARLLHDIGMEHYSKIPYRWCMARYSMWSRQRLQADLQKVENELNCLKEENTLAKEKLKQDSEQALGIPFITCHGLRVVSLHTFSCDEKPVNKPCGGNVPKFFLERTMASMTLSSNVYNFPNTTGWMRSASREVPKLLKCQSRINLGMVQGIYKQGQDRHMFGLHASQTGSVAIPNSGFIRGIPHQWRGFSRVCSNILGA